MCILCALDWKSSAIKLAQGSLDFNNRYVIGSLLLISYTFSLQFLHNFFTFLHALLSSYEVVSFIIKD
jgi:hypothetical protein